MGENNDSILKVVQLFIDNINESTKSTSKELDRINGEVGGVKTKINTPPRNEELSAQIQEVADEIEVINNNLISTESSIKSMITSVRVAVAVIAFAIIISSGITQCGSYINDKSIERKVEQYLTHIDKEKSNKIIPEID